MAANREFRLKRRGFLASLGAAAASSLLPNVSLAATSGDRRLVVILLRGGMDGVDLVQPYGDANLGVLRPDLALTPASGLIDLDGFFGLHPAASGLMSLWRAGHLSFAHAIASPYRGRSSHFEAQDVIETGNPIGSGSRTGWLNRALALIPRTASRAAVDITTSVELIMTGGNKTDVWATQSDFPLAQDEINSLQALFQTDPVFGKAGAGMSDLDPLPPIVNPQARMTGIADLAKLAGSLLAEDYRVASFSLAGWDTHQEQKRSFAEAVRLLTEAILHLQAGMGEAAWQQTAVVAITEFGRTLRLNSMGGTDHGTASAALLAGGAIAGGRVLADWPGLAEGQLFEGRDLAPTRDIRELLAALLFQQFEITAANLNAKVFPGLGFDPSSLFVKTN
ncbi:uncharacterized protein (DUF1501 family) [Rhizobium rhizoryzae]|uniref:Uncharacterized protein (DUF1501 family) n=2 Tax=Rhizobium rhizoryzae TaxID=451876 RepID=A0A7W6PNG9_9HYPH|nr:uncharacterized protein (DUF1501 family) [Rhizobium rhizoryzae]